MSKKDALLLVQEDCLKATRGLVESYISKCTALENMLALIRSHPNFLGLFSSDEVLEINLKQREIPGIKQNLLELRQTVCLDSMPLFFENGASRNRLWEIEKELASMLAFFEEKRARLINKKFQLLFYFIFPFTTLGHLVSLLYYKIRMKKEERERRKMIRKREDIRKKSQKIKSDKADNFPA